MSEFPTARGFPMAEVVARTGLAAPTIRYYLAEGLLPPPTRVSSNRFLYDERHVEVIRVIRLLRERRGLSIETIRSLLPEMLPELLDRAAARTFRPEMWRDLLVSHQGDSARSLRDRLLDAAISAFAARGYSDVSIDDIAHSVGIAKGSFYRHFASKEALFFAACGRVADCVLQIAEGHVERGGVLSSEAIAAGLVAYAPIVFELASQAARGRSEHVQALEALLAGLVHGLAGRDGRGETAARALLSRALGDTVQAAASGPAGVPEAPAEVSA